MANFVHAGPGDYTVGFGRRSENLHNGVSLDSVWCHYADDIFWVEVKVKHPTRLIVNIFVSVRNISRWLPSSVRKRQIQSPFVLKSSLAVSLGVALGFG